MPHIKSVLFKPLHNRWLPVFFGLEVSTVPREVAAKDSAMPVHAFQLSVVPFGLCDGFYHITRVHWGICGRRCLSIVVVKRVLIFFFLSQTLMLILFSAPVGRRGGGLEGCDANMSTQQNRLLVKTRTLLQSSMKTHKKVNTNCPRYDHTQSHTHTRDGRWNATGANLGGSGVKKQATCPQQRFLRGES